MSDIQKAFYLLFFSIILDFCSGVYASFVEYQIKYNIKGFKNKVNAFFFEVVKSEKIRKSILKTLSYFLIAMITYFIETIFFLNEVPTKENKENLSITIWIILICSLIELYSTFFENVKRAGFDIKSSFMETIKGVKELVKEIKDFFNTLK